MSACAITPITVAGKSGFNVLDIVVIILYFAVLFCISFYIYRTRSASSANFFLADRDSVWWAVGFSLFSSNIGTEHLVGLAGSGAATGIAVGVYEWTAAFELMVLAWLFVPFYLSSKVYTMPEFLGKRYDVRSRTIYAVISLVASVLTKIAPTLFAGSLVLYDIFGWSIYASASVMSVITGLYTASGGLAAVIYTEVMQTTVMVLGACTILFVGLGRVGGLQGLYDCPDLIPRNFFELFKPASDPTFPWTGLMLAHPLTIGLWYWNSDQVIVQRVLSAKDTEHARGGCVVAGFLKMLPMFTMVLPGLMARALYHKQVLENTNNAYALLVIELLPKGVHGIMLACMLAAMMSSLASEFNSVATIFAVDVYQVLRPRSTGPILVYVGRLATIGLVVVAMLWIPFIGILSDQLYVYMNKIQANLSPPIAACFFMGVLWPRANGAGALAAFIWGTFWGTVRLSCEIYFAKRPASGIWVMFAAPTETSPGLNFLHFGLINMLCTCLVLAIVSLLTDPPPVEKIAGMTLFTKHMAIVDDNKSFEHFLYYDTAKSSEDPSTPPPSTTITTTTNHAHVHSRPKNLPHDSSSQALLPPSIGTTTPNRRATHLEEPEEELIIDGPLALPVSASRPSIAPYKGMRFFTQPSFFGSCVLMLVTLVLFISVDNWKYRY